MSKGTSLTGARKHDKQARIMRRVTYCGIECQRQRAIYEKEKKIQDEEEMKNLKPIFEFFELKYKKILGKAVTDSIIGQFKRPPSKYGVIVRIGKALEDVGVQSEDWIDEATNIFL